MTKLSTDDKNKFKKEVRKLDAIELLNLCREIEKLNLSKADRKFCNCHIGERCERLLRESVRNIKRK
ncbi:MAG: hypothetical protein ACTSPI_10295 [Candidatus Heimdallarchaeaceae archaeon]